MLPIKGMVSSLDEGVGTIADALEKSGHMDNTVFIFLSDVCFYFHTKKLIFRNSKKLGVSLYIPSDGK